MKKTFLLPVLAAALSACGTGLIPPITRDLDPITLTLPAASSVNPLVYYSNVNQMATLNDVTKLINSVQIAGNALYTGYGNLSGVTLYLRSTLDGCTVAGDYVACTGDESANKVQTVAIVKGQPVPFTLSGPLLNKAVQSHIGYLGVQVTGGNVVQGDKLNISDARVTVRF